MFNLRLSRTLIALSKDFSLAKLKKIFLKKLQNFISEYQMTDLRTRVIGRELENIEELGADELELIFLLEDF